MPEQVELISSLRAELARRPVPFRLRLLNAMLNAAGMTKVEGVSDRVMLARQQAPPDNMLMRMMLGPRAQNVRIQDEHLASSGGPILARLHIPDRRQHPAPCLLFIHGGGWSSGHLSMTDWWCSGFAARTGAVVVSINYRLAPQHQFPAGLEDCLAALTWLAREKDRLELNLEHLGVAGDSAGGNLAAALCLYARRQGGPPIAQQILLYPALDLTCGSPSYVENANAPLLSAANARACIKLYLASAAQAEDPLASPLLADDLTGLPPALIQVAEHDPLRDDGWRYAIRLEQAGVPVRVSEYAGAPHGFAQGPGVSRFAPHALEEAASHFLEPTYSSFAAKP